MFDTVLVANRGEIALRVVRACRELGLRSIAVYSDEDAGSAAVRFADDAVRIGPASARHSYLNIPSIVAAALQRDAQAVHPGYGFLSEDPDFAEICQAHGLEFIGPPPAVLARLGDKSIARSIMREAGLPLLPGTTEPVDTADDAERVATRIGFPLIVKAVAGGGGRGMRVAGDPSELRGCYLRTRADARSLYRDSRVYLERYLEHARHVEVQVLCDTAGNAVWLGERDCTVQRRHQKLIEETPAPALDPGLLGRMREAAVHGARAAGFVGAGTFEFLVDERGGFHFLEVNGRIQVEHPVTEMATGIDLVAEQIRIARGAALTLTQADVQPRGVAIECRVNAEDPARGFAPAPGVLSTFRLPGGPFVRVDTHGYTGLRVSPHYDSLLAKVVVWAPDRPAAIRRMHRALSEFEIGGPGVHTTREMLLTVLDDPVFTEARHHTGSVAEMLREAGHVVA